MSQLDSTAELIDERGILYVATGPQYTEEAVCSINSVREFNADIPICLRTTESLINRDLPKNVTVERINSVSGLWCKPLHISDLPFQKTLFLDTDVVCVHQDAMLPFDVLDRFDFAMAHAPARNYDHLPTIPNCVSTYNSGVMFINGNRPGVQSLLEAWKVIYEPSKNTKRVSDQSLLSRVLWHNNARVFVLPPEWNCRGRCSGIPNVADLRFIHHRQAVAAKMKNALIPAEFLADGKF